ncbi:MAG: ankyrin repeat domain-containing protein, partial [Pseudomonadota bacterium]
MTSVQDPVDFLCSHCGYGRKIPPDRFPQGKTRFNVTCPKCRNKTILDLGVKKLEPPAPQPSAPVPSKIRQMILDQRTNGVLNLPPGEYFGQVVIDKPLTLEGAGKATWIGWKESPTIRITSHGVVIRNVVVEATNESEKIAIEAFPGTDPILVGVILRGTTVGMRPENIRDADFVEVPPIKIKFVPPPPIKKSPVEDSVQISSAASFVSVPPPVSYTDKKIASLFEEADRAEKNDDWNKAVRLYEDILSLSPAHPDAEKLLDRARRNGGVSEIVQASSVPSPAPIQPHVSVAKPVTDPALNEQLLQAADMGRLDEVKRLLDRGAAIDPKDSEGWTALMWAAAEGHASVVQLLLERGADTHAKDHWKDTALDRARAKGHAEVVKLLEAGGAPGKAAVPATPIRPPARAVTSLGQTSPTQPSPHVPAPKRATDFALDGQLLKEAETGCLDEVTRLLDRGADIEHENEKGWTALMRAAGNGHGPVVTLLLDRGAAIDWNAYSWRSGGYRTALTMAAAGGHASVVRLLLDRGAAIDLADEFGHTALSWAATMGRVSVVQLLLGRGANINRVGNHDKTALMAAAEGGHVSVVQLLLDRGADTHAKDIAGGTALDHARKHGSTAVVKLLRAHGAPGKK